MKKGLLLLCAVIMAYCFIACSEDEEMVIYPYSYSISGYHSESMQNDLTTITDYLTRKGCFLDSKSFSGKSVAAIDEAAKLYFQKSAQKINVDEIKQLGLAKGTSFTYSVSRLANPYAANSKAITIDKFSYTQE